MHPVHFKCVNVYEDFCHFINNKNIERKRKEVDKAESL